MGDRLIEVKDLKTHFFSLSGVVRAVDGVTLHVNKGETLALVGESGSGKSVTALSIMRLLPSPPAKIVDGEIDFAGENLLSKSDDEIRAIRGNEISMIFQEPMTSLNPVFTCGDQISESIRLHQGLDRADAMAQAVDMLRKVGIPSPEIRVKEYPHQLSGGMRQRVMIAMALSCNPRLLIADEPTTALDVTIQVQILELMKKLKEEIGMSILLITHDLGVVAEMAQRVVVMYGGRIVEQAPVEKLFECPLHPYTEGLMRSLPQLDKRVERLHTIEGMVPNPLHLPRGCPFSPRCPKAMDICREEQPPMLEVAPGRTSACWLHSDASDKTIVCPSSEHPSPSLEQISKEAGVAQEAESVTVHRDTGSCAEAIPVQDDADTDRVLLVVEDLKKHFPITGGFLSRVRGYVKAVDGVSFSIMDGETFGLVGESGCGKSTLGKVILRLLDATEGQVTFEGRDIFGISDEEMRALRRKMQVVFQDPYSSLNPRMTVGDIVGEPLGFHGIAKGAEKSQEVERLLEVVGLPSNHIHRYPHEFSGGQRQRIGIARALAVSPKLLICDEPVSALDVSIRSQILNLLADLQQDFGLTYLFIAHDLAVVRHLSDRVGVMYLGKMMELATSEELYQNPLHPYTQALMSAIPIPNPGARRKRIILKGDVPSPVNPPAGCRFHERCRLVKPICREVEPSLSVVGSGHAVACHACM
jgi:peptide/nickel transport system ATP-binding protein